jgi:hypothetical protein
MSQTMDRLHLDVESSTNGGISRRVTRLRDDRGTSPIEIFHEFDREVPWSHDTLFDGHVLVILLHAMSRGKPLVVHGPISRAALRNIEELQRAWARWRPETCKKIEILSDRIVDARRVGATEQAISAFSGGVDAVFTAIRHKRTLPESIRYPLSAVLMVHGFDVALENASYFEQLVKRVRPILDELDLRLRVIRTNSMALHLQNWEDSHGLEIAGCLHMLADDYQVGLIGSSEPYDALILPWGSNPVTDHLMSGDRFTVIHDGAGFARTDKVAEIGHVPVVRQSLKVCWEGADQSANCGYCEKCVRTRLNFLAAGCGSPPCFPGELEAKDIMSIPIRNPVQLAELAGIVRYATSRGVEEPWLPVLKERLAEWHDAGLRENNASRQDSAIGIEAPQQPAKKWWQRLRRSA